VKTKTKWCRRSGAVLPKPKRMRKRPWEDRSYATRKPSLRPTQADAVAVKVFLFMARAAARTSGNNCLSRPLRIASSHGVLGSPPPSPIAHPRRHVTTVIGTIERPLSGAMAEPRRRVATAAAASAPAASANSSNTSGYRMPPEVLRQIVDHEASGRKRENPDSQLSSVADPTQLAHRCCAPTPRAG